MSQQGDHSGPFPAGCPLDGSFWERLGEIKVHMEAISHSLQVQNGRIAKSEGSLSTHLHHHDLETAKEAGKKDVFLTTTQIRRWWIILVAVGAATSGMADFIFHMIEQSGGLP